MSLCARRHLPNVTSLCPSGYRGIQTWLRIRFDGVHLALALCQRPRLLHLASRHAAQLWQPVSQVVAFWVVHHRLPKDVETHDTTVTQVSSRNPVAPVAADIVINEPPLKPVGAAPPIHTQVQRQERGHVLPVSVRHPARRLQLSHVCVDEREPSTPIGPELELAITPTPRWSLAQQAALAEYRCAVFCCLKAKEVAGHE
mmetsp:Transcript_6871/g.18998  ORF Transcript_6871/g.18998 Transcript_6871/m.18998 type:complete len:200 (-) Transcript_6871:986-1585(-)